MDESYAHPAVHDGHGRCCNPSQAGPATDQTPYSQRMTPHHTHAHISPTPYHLAMTFSNEALVCRSSARSCDTSLHQAFSHFAGADPGPGQDQQQRIRLHSKTDSEQVAWQVHGQNFPATPSTSYSGSQLAAQGLPPCLTLEPIRDHSPSPLPSDAAQLEALKSYSDEWGLSPERPSDRSNSNSSWASGSRVVDFSQIHQSQVGAAPWSSINPRRGFPESEHANQGLDIIPGFTNDPYSELSDAFNGGHENLVEYQEMSAAIFNDINGIMEDLSMISEPSGDYQPPHDVEDIVPSNGVPFVWRVDRVGTPFEAAASVQNDQVENSVVYLDPGNCVPLRSHDHDQSSHSSDSSRLSATPSSKPSIINCNIPGCCASFSGLYRQGNLNRHLRRKHRGLSGDHLCEHPSCGRSFNRSDSRLKHYRKYHPWLAPNPLIPRGPQIARSSRRG